MKTKPTLTNVDLARRAAAGSYRQSDLRFYDDIIARMSNLWRAFEGTAPPFIGLRRFSVTACYFIIAFVLAFHFYRIPGYSIDLLGYAGNVALNETDDIVRAHDAVYSESLTPHLLGQDANDEQAMVLRRRAADSYYSAMYLPYFSIKPLYIMIFQAVNRQGAGLVQSSRIVAAVGYLAIAIILWLYSRSFFAILLLLLPEAVVLGQADGPDGLSVFLLLTGLWLLFVRQQDLGLLPTILAMWVRPDNLILCLLAVLMLFANGRLDRIKATVLVLLCLGSSALISHYAYGWRELCFHTFLDGEPGQIAHFGFADYRQALAEGFGQVAHSSLILYVLLWLACFKAMGEGLQRIMILSAAYCIIRFAMFPSFQTRYYSLFFLTTGIAALRLGSRNRGAWKQRIEKLFAQAH